MDVMANKSKNVHTNRLISEKSPYLLQHAHNPVDWYPWGQEAFEEAKNQDKPVFLSIGYSTCHWCHVMEKESFEDPRVATLMNAAFVSIKVDREERPDVDDLYMTVCQMMTDSGGWPLTIIMTPDKQPFFAATYVPRESRFGQVGLLDLIPQIQDLWRKKRERLTRAATDIRAALEESALAAPGARLDEGALELAFDQLAAMFDEEHGGFGSAPKFPAAHHVVFLLRYWLRTENDRALHMVETTLQGMRRGGVFDQIGLGFHRYSTDSRWLLPHFEKMLYDQALLTLAYVEAAQATHREEYAQTVREILTYVLRDMTDRAGAFYSAEDADSEGEEGKFYVWSENEIRGMLPEKEAGVVLRVFGFEPEGNFAEQATGKRTGRNVPHRKQALAADAAMLKISEEELRKLLDAARRKLFEAREKRMHPDKDDKILTDWNGLMIAALAKAGRALAEPAYSDAARRAADFILGHMRDEKGRLYHRYRDGEAAVPGFLDDYAFFIWGLIELYEATFDAKYLEVALELNNLLVEHFWDGEQGGFHRIADDAEPLLVRRKEGHDGAIPSGNSVSMMNLLRLARMTANPELEARATRIGQVFSADALASPAGFTQLMTAVDFALGPTYEIVIVGNPEKNDTKAMQRALNEKYLPNKVLLQFPTPGTAADIVRLAPFLKDYKAIDGKATAYVCRNHQCQLPTTQTTEMLRLLNVKS
jgi:uncharacterized protein YyaL (SSP411 family)